MKRILIFNDTLACGGAEAQLIKLLEYLIVRRCDVTLLLPDPSVDMSLKEKLPKAVDIKFVRNSSNKIARIAELNLMMFAPKAYRAIKGFDFDSYDAVICFKESFYARLFSEIKSYRVLWIHTLMYERNYALQSIKERLAVALNKKHIELANEEYKNFHRLVCVSETCRESTLKTLNCTPAQSSKVHVVYNFINEDFILEKAKEKEVKLEVGRVNFVNITRNSPDKGFDRLLDAVERLSKEYYNFHVYIIGGGFNADIVKEELVEREIDIFVTFLGELENPYPYVIRASWLLCTSVRESFSLAVLEALVLNTPVVSTACGGPEEILKHGKYGLLLENSPEGVYKGLETIIKNKGIQKLDYLSINAELERFSQPVWQSKVDDILNLNN